MNVLVTGGTGYIGSHTCVELLNEGYGVVVIDNLCNSNPKSLERVKEITGKELPKYYRPPQGIYSQENLRMAKDLGYQTVFWSLAYVDWNNNAQPTHKEAFQKLLPRTHNGAVVLLHSTSQTNAEILDELLTKWKEQGYTFASIDKLFAQ